MGAEKSRYAMVNNLRKRTMVIHQDGRAAGQGLNEDQPERFRPKGTEQGDGVPKECIFLGIRQFSDILDRSV